MSQDFAALARETVRKETEEAQIDIGPDRKALRTMWEVPAIRQFLTSFRQQLSISMFTSEELEIALAGSVDYDNVLLHEIHVKLLRGLCYSRSKDAIAQYSWQDYLHKFLRNNDHKFHETIDSYEKLPIRDRVKLLLYLCEKRIEEEDFREKMREDGDLVFQLRELPIGYDSHGNYYFYFDNDIRLYKQMKIGHSRRSFKQQPAFSLVASTVKEWEKFCRLLKHSKHAEEREMLSVLENDVIPVIKTEIEASLRARERKTMWDILPRRRSGRVAVKLLEDERLAAERTLYEQQAELDRIRVKKERERRQRSRRALERRCLTVDPIVLGIKEQERAKRAEYRTQRNAMLRELEENQESEQVIRREEQVREREKRRIHREVAQPPPKRLKYDFESDSEPEKPLPSFSPPFVPPSKVVNISCDDGTKWTFSHFPSMPEPKYTPKKWKQMILDGSSMSYTTKWPHVDGYDQCVADVVSEYEGRVSVDRHIQAEDKKKRKEGTLEQAVAVQRQMMATNYQVRNPMVAQPVFAYPYGLYQQPQ